MHGDDDDDAEEERLLFNTMGTELVRRLRCTYGLII